MKTRFIATVFWGLVGAFLMAGVAASHWSDPRVGFAAGAVLIGFVGHGVSAGWISPVLLCSTIPGLVFCMIGPGCDDYQGIAGFWAALVGAIVGRQVFGSRRLARAADCHCQESKVPDPLTGEEA